MQTLTIQDIELIIDAVDAWESAPNEKSFSTSLLKAMNPFASRADFEKEIEGSVAKSLMECRLRRDKGTLVRAKLIMLKAEMMDALSREGETKSA